MKIDNRKTVIFVATRHFAIFSSRELIIRALIDYGYKIIVFGEADKTTPKLHDLNVETMNVRFDKTGFNIFVDSLFFVKLMQLILLKRPILIHFFHAKPIIFGGLASVFLKSWNLRICATVTGLGRAFKQSLFKRFVAQIAYKLLLKNYDSVIFQNQDDQRLFLENKWTNNYSAHLVLGSGVDLIRFRSVNKTIRRKIVFVSRLIKQKGVGDFLMLAERLSSRFPEYEFVLGGEYDENDPDTYSITNIMDSEMAGFLKYESYVSNMIELLNQSVLFIFPSVYPEGVPRVCIEAIASGVPVVAYDIPGTREIVVNDISGIAVESGNYKKLENAVCRLLTNDKKRHSLAVSGRVFVEKEFDLKNVVKKYLSIYQLKKLI